MTSRAGDSAPAGGYHDVAILGGGASGLAAALAAAREGASVALIERDVEAGLSILATGNGRCNVSNAHLDPARYLHPRAARAVMGSAPEVKLERFFASIGLLTAREGDRLYPYSKRAESVRDALLDACAREGVTIICGADLDRTRFEGAAWQISLSVPSKPLKMPRKSTFHAELRARRRALQNATRTPLLLEASRLVIACGGASDTLCAQLGVPHREEEPVLCPVACTFDADADALAYLDGIRQEGALALVRDGETCWRERGEVLFRPYGLSGIVAFNLSRRARGGDAISLDLFPDYPEEELIDLLRQRELQVGALADSDERWYRGLIASAVARAVMSAAENARDTRAIAHACKHLIFTYQGRTETQTAQVRRGGIPFDAVDLGTLEVEPSHALHLHACGEALDQDADCGGFNLAWAWLTGLRAGVAAARAARTH